MSETFFSKAEDENGDGLDVERVVQVGSGDTSGMVTEDSETFSLLYPTRYGATEVDDSSF
jgi:hypothetical protein